MSLLDLTNVSENGIEDGDYVATVSHAEVKSTKNGDGEYIKVCFETDKGQKIYHNFNIKNKSEKAAQIGLGQLKTFLRVSGKSNPNNLGGVAELMGLKALIKVKNEDAGDYGMQTRIKNFKPATGAAVASSGPENAVPF